MISAKDISYKEKYNNVSIKDINSLGIEYYEFFYKTVWWSVIRYKNEVATFPIDEKSRVIPAISFFIKEMYVKFNVLHNIDINIIRDTTFTDILAEYIYEHKFVVARPFSLDKFANIISSIDDSIIISSGLEDPSTIKITFDDINTYGEVIDKELAKQNLIKSSLIGAILTYKYRITSNKKDIIKRLNLERYTSTNTKSISINKKRILIKGILYKIDFSKEIFVTKEEINGID